MAAETGDQFYSIADDDAQRTYVGVRRAEEWVGFFLPHLQPGMKVLDCGCGVGSITLDLAERVSPGQVVGIDVDETQLAVARKGAAERGLTNVSFEQGDVYHLHFDDSSFDAVLAHTLLMHLSDRAHVIGEMRRVLRAGGVIGIADDDFDTITYSPDDGLMQKQVDLWTRVVQHNGGDPFYSRHLRRELLQAGFARTEGYAVAADHYGTLEETRRFAAISGRLWQTDNIASLVIEQGWVTQEELDEIVAWIEAWGERSDAFLSVAYCAAVGWK